jgi:chromosomal replication initiation ATPase DnaA
VLKQIENIEQEVSEPQMAILESIANVNLFLAGTGSGKTHLGGILAINFIKQFPEVRGAIFANTFDQLNTSTLFRIRDKM